jgi:hypothetical protein
MVFLKVADTRLPGTSTRVLGRVLSGTMSVSGAWEMQLV